MYYYFVFFVKLTFFPKRTLAMARTTKRAFGNNWSRTLQAVIQPTVSKHRGKLKAMTFSR